MNTGRDSEAASGESQRTWWFAFLAVAGGLVLLRAIGPLWTRPVLAWGGFAMAGLGWLAAIGWLARATAGGADGGAHAGAHAGAGSRVPRTRTILAGALVLRALVFGADFALSDDVYRYVWEGALVAEGKSPYAHAPEHPSWSAEREQWPLTFARINHPQVPAAYPPVTQYLCAFGVVLGRTLLPGRSLDAAGLLGVRLVFALCDLLCVLPLALLCRLLGRSPAWALVWGWSPLVALEFSGSTHFDSAGILLLLCALALFSDAARRGSAARWPSAGLAGATLALAFLVKYLPIVALPFVLRSSPKRGFALTTLVPFALVTALLAVPFLFFDPAGFGHSRGLASYAFRWESTSLLYRFLEAPLAAFWRFDESWTDPRRLARFGIALLWLAVALWLLIRRAPPWRASGALIGLFLCLSPTLHPWYVAWIVPFLALRPAPAWLWLTFAGPLLYAPAFSSRAGGEWVEPAWLWPSVALPFLALALFGALRTSSPNRT